jgi:hypothetical protein
MRLRWIPADDPPHEIVFVVSIFLLIGGTAMAILPLFQWSSAMHHYLLVGFGVMIFIGGLGLFCTVDFSKVFKKKERKITYWNCPRCGTENTSEHVGCWKCETPRQDGFRPPES